MGVYISVTKQRCWPQYSHARAPTTVRKVFATYTEKIQSHVHLRHNHSAAICLGRRITSPLYIAEACAYCSISPHTCATRVCMPHHMLLQPTVTHLHLFPSYGDECSHVQMCGPLLQLTCGQHAHLPQKWAFTSQ